MPTNCPHCNTRPIQTVFLTCGELLCQECTMAGFPAQLARLRTLPPIYSVHATHRPDLFPELN